jgi:AbrB family looped-hinge helix DNA binding protein
MPTATISSKGQVTIPKSVRDLLRVETGDEVDFFVNDRGDVVVRGVGGDVRELKGFLKRPGQRRLSVEEMNAAIGQAHARKR